MTALITIICIWGIIISLKLEKRLYNPLCVFLMLWMIITLAAGISAFGIYKADINTYLIVFLGILFYLMGYLVFSAANKQIVFYKSRDKRSKSYKTYLNYKLVYVIALVGIVYFFSMALVAVPYLLKGQSLTFVRKSLFYYQDSELYEGGLAYAIKAYIMQTIVDFFPIVVAVDLVIGKRDKILAILNIVLLGLYVLVSGGRLCILYFMIDIITAYEIANNKINFTKMQKTLIKSLLIIISSLIVIISISRGIEQLSKSYYVYLAGCYPYLQIFATKVNEAEFYGWGTSTFRGLLQAVFAGLKLFRLIGHYPAIFMNMAKYCDTTEVFLIGDNIRFNGFVTIFYYFYVDFHYWGVILGSFFYGGICRNIYHKARVNTDERSVAILCCLMQSIIVSFARFEFSLVHFFLATILVIFSYKRRYYG